MGWKSSTDHLPLNFVYSVYNFIEILSDQVLQAIIKLFLCELCFLLWTVTHELLCLSLQGAQCIPLAQDSLRISFEAGALCYQSGACTDSVPHAHHQPETPVSLFPPPVPSRKLAPRALSCKVVMVYLVPFCVWTSPVWLFALHT